MLYHTIVMIQQSVYLDVSDLPMKKRCYQQSQPVHLGTFGQ
ncbi:hypothetical protein GCWU000325_02556 [Alloprevotella tannerae ATCC 51259]|uniref:Uncharacterized protein n=1 Tax=Alloprevotella tannerae ATCC 51259 TaxID=626522 RepID=C9LJZ2_9BACT|nr:hypothetical protein GCWU000325_02556 [Alloprevotella tannerae ATCC 51259]